MGVALALLAAVFYGSADFCGGLATKRNPIFAVAVVSQAAGLVLLLALRPFMHVHAVPSDYLYGALGGLCGGAGLALLYHALSIGKMGVVSPITAVLAAALPLGVGALRGERIDTLQFVGIGLALVAIALISFSQDAPGTREIATAGVKEAIASGLILGGFYVFLSYTHASAGLDNLLAARVASVTFLAFAGIVARSRLVPRLADLRLVIGGGLLDMTANAFYVVATYDGNLAIAAVLTSLYPASTVFLARFVLRERLGGIQKAGVGLALAGVVLIAAR